MVCLAKPQYRFDAANHIHLLDDQPLMGTSTVVGVIAKQLSFWAAGMAIKRVFGIPDAKVLTKLKNGKITKAEKQALWDALAEWIEWVRLVEVEEVAQLCIEAYFAHSKELKETADAGTDLHCLLSIYVEWTLLFNDGSPKPLSELPGNEFRGIDNPQVMEFAAWALQNVKRFLWSEKHCYSETLWVGGICDCGAILNNDRVAVIDFKSGKGPYFSQHVQCGGYAALIAENGLFEADGTPYGNVERIIAQDCIVFPFKGDGPRTEKAHWLTDVFDNVVALYKGQQEYDQ